MRVKKLSIKKLESESHEIPKSYLPKQKHGKKNEHYVNPIELDEKIITYYSTNIMTENT